MGSLNLIAWREKRVKKYFSVDFYCKRVPSFALVYFFLLLFCVLKVTSIYHSEVYITATIQRSGGKTTRKKRKTDILLHHILIYTFSLKERLRPTSEKRHIY